MLAWRLQQKNLPPTSPIAIITGTNHTVQNCKGEFIIKDKQTPDDKISKKTITNHHNIHLDQNTKCNLTPKTNDLVLNIP